MQEMDGPLMLITALVPSTHYQESSNLVLAMLLLLDPTSGVEIYKKKVSSVCLPRQCHCTHKKIISNK